LGQDVAGVGKKGVLAGSRSCLWKTAKGKGGGVGNWVKKAQRSRSREEEKKIWAKRVGGRS